MNRRIVIFNNIPSPYSVDLNQAIQNACEGDEIFSVYTNKNEDNRMWNTDLSALDHVMILESKILKLKTAHDYRYIHFPPSIFKVLNSIDPDVVIAKEYNPSAVQSLLFCKARHIPYIHVTEGTLLSERSINPVQKLLRRWIISGADHCIAASTKAKEKLYYWGAKESDVDIAYLTFDLKPFQSIRRDIKPGTLLYVGSMAERKGLDLLIQALPYAPSVKEVRIVGNGSEEQLRQYTETAERFGVRDKIVFAGFKTGEKLREEYARASVFVLPTREDCFGLVLLEAMVAGLPIVASSYADGAYDVVADGHNGRIADPFQSEAFGRAIEQVMSDPSFQEKAKTMDYSPFALDHVAGVYRDVIETLVNRT